MIVDPSYLSPDRLSEIINGAGLVKRKSGTHIRKNERDVINLVTAFDIETTTLHFPPTDETAHNDHSFMYVWQWQWGSDLTVVGRYWEEFMQIIHDITDVCSQLRQEKGLEKNPLLIVYIHNLSFEWQFLAGIYHFTDDECFFRASRKPIYCRMFDSIEYRCSYIHSNMTLKMFAERMGCKTRKQSGQKFDYTKIRYPWTPLTDDELLYCIDDVISLQEAITNEMARDGDTLKSIPYTSTGYVRRDLRHAIAPIRKSIIEPTLPDEKAYRMLRKAFRGGNTHGNRFYTGKILDNVYSVDMSSCYPAQLLTRDFPASKWYFMKEPIDKDKLLRRINAGFAVVMTISFTGLRLINPNEPIPYISLSKTESIGFITDNGRILSAESSTMTVTEIDLHIILRQYTFNTMQFLHAMEASKKPLPELFKEVVREYYRRKTNLKGVKSAVIDGVKVDAEGVAYYYAKSKNKLNSLYGCAATDPIHAKVTYTEGALQEFHRSSYEDFDAQQIAKKLGEATLNYAWGVYCTAWARYSLQQGIDACGDDIVYCDTDSLKTAREVDMQEINTKRQKMAQLNGACAQDPKGKMHFMGVFESEGRYDKFVHQGAKRYCYEQDGDMHIVVAGVSCSVNELTGVPFAVEELKTMEAFKPGMIWDIAGGTAAVYNDNDDFDYTDPETGRSVHIGRNVAIVDTSYTMKYATDYKWLLDAISNGITFENYRKERE